MLKIGQYLAKDMTKVCDFLFRPPCRPSLYQIFTATAYTAYNKACTAQYSVTMRGPSIWRTDGCRQFQLIEAAFIARANAKLYRTRHL